MTSPRPWVTSMLVLQLRISTNRDGPLGELVGVTLGVSSLSEGVSVGVVVTSGVPEGVSVAVGNEKAVAVAI